jgi:hypothetical protein
MNVTNSFIGIFLDANSFGEIANSNIITTGYGIRFGELTRFRLFNTTIQAQAPLTLQFLVSLDLYGTFNLLGGYPGSPMISLESQNVLHVGGITSIINNTINASPIITTGINSNVAFDTAVGIFWSTAVGYPLVSVIKMSSLNMPAALSNNNTANPTGIVSCGANAIGAMVTQDDFNATNSQKCVCVAF